jgi:hypothetical protein
VRPITTGFHVLLHAAAGPLPVGRGAVDILFPNRAKVQFPRQAGWTIVLVQNGVAALPSSSQVFVRVLKSRHSHPQLLSRVLSTSKQEVSFLKPYFCPPLVKIMSGNMRSVPVPCKTDQSPSSSSSGFTYHGATYNSRINAWLMEVHKDMPWNIINSVPAPTSNEGPHAHAVAVSEAAATQGSTKSTRQ